MSPQSVTIFMIISFFICFGGTWFQFGSLSDMLFSLWQFIKSDVMGWLPYVIGLAVLWEVLMHALHGSREDQVKRPESHALAKHEPAMDIEYIDGVLDVRAGDTLVVANSRKRVEATAREDVKIGIKRNWRGW